MPQLAKGPRRVIINKLPCSTIASACNLYWRRSILEDTPAAKIAARPLRGWHGAQVNESHAALQWLAYRESLLSHDGADRIKHAQNGGEKKLRTEKGKEYVDGYDERENMMYEFMGVPRVLPSQTESETLHYARPYPKSSLLSYL